MYAAVVFDLGGMTLENCKRHELRGETGDTWKCGLAVAL
jgi:hypothetical protein